MTALARLAENPFLVIAGWTLLLVIWESAVLAVLLEGWRLLRRIASPPVRRSSPVKYRPAHAADVRHLGKEGLIPWNQRSDAIPWKRFLLDQRGELARDGEVARRGRRLPGLRMARSISVSMVTACPPDLEGRAYDESDVQARIDGQERTHMSRAAATSSHGP